MSLPQLIDSHTHLDSSDFSHDLDDIFERARNAGVAGFVTVGAGGDGGLTSARNAVALAKAHGDVWASVGVHPHHGETPFDLTELKALASEERVVAIGETGLDFYRDWCPVDLQYLWFRAQVELALEVKKPIIIHSRNAAEECFKVLVELGAEKVGGVFHCYSEDAAFAKRLRSINFLVSFPGSVTFKKSEALREAVKNIPVDQIMVETDAPYMAPEPYRGKRCESAYVVETAKKIAAVKGMEYAEFARIATETTRNFFKIR